jgi:alpha-galactosidase
MWRRWYHAHVLPRPNGRPLTPALAGYGPGDGDEFTEATEENQLRHIDLAKQRGIDFDVWWIDAGWYPCYDDNHQRNWHVTGTWHPDPERFPRGLEPVSDAVTKNGADFLLWFEPERVRPNTQLDRDHPDWLLKVDGAENHLLNLGHPQCRQWLTDHVCKQIEDNGIKIYRQDFNFPPLDHWRLNESDDRQGINENLYVQGYLQYWDDLLARNPGLWIDSCASGGRRNDLETMRRSVPLHYTDHGYGKHPVKLAFHRMLFEWIPYFKCPTSSWDLVGRELFDPCVDSFSYHCAMAAMLFPTIDVRRDDHDYELAQKMIAIWRKACNLILHGDYYQHTPYHISSEQWVAWQFQSPKNPRGLIQGFRLPDAPQETLTIYPKCIDLSATYIFENPETSQTSTISGKDLIEKGFTFKLPPRSAAIWLYRPISQTTAHRPRK